MPPKKNNTIKAQNLCKRFCAFLLYRSSVYNTKLHEMCIIITKHGEK